MSPTQRSLNLIRKQGWLVDVVEYYNYFSKRRKDLFGIWDLVCCCPGQVAFIQTTTKGNMAARKKKIKAHPDIDIMRESGAQLVIHGWYKTKGRWMVKIEEVT